MRIDSSGNVGIGESDPSGYWAQADNLVLGGTGNDGITIKSATTGNGRLVFTDTKSSTAGLNDGGMIAYNHPNDEMTLRTAGTDRVTIDSSGNVGIGTIGPSEKLSIFGNNQPNVLGLSTNSADGARIDLKRTTSGGIYSELGSLNFRQSDNTLLGRARSTDPDWQAEIEVSPGASVEQPREELEQIPGVARIAAAFQAEATLSLPEAAPDEQQLVGLIALALGIEAPFVAVHHMGRIFMVVILASVMGRVLARGRSGG